MLVKAVIEDQIIAVEAVGIRVFKSSSKIHLYLANGFMLELLMNPKNWRGTDSLGMVEEIAGGTFKMFLPASHAKLKKMEVMF